MKWKRKTVLWADKSRGVWTSGRFAITKGPREDKYRVWYGMAFVGLFDKLKDAKSRIEGNINEFSED